MNEDDYDHSDELRERLDQEHEDWEREQIDKQLNEDD